MRILIRSTEGIYMYAATLTRIVAVAQDEDSWIHALQVANALYWLAV